jgi:N-acetylglutamate synthase-like GNAT family acetyltransferase
MMLTIRKAELKDFQTIINIMKESASPDELRGFVPPEGISPKFLEELEEELDRSDPSVIVAEKGKISIGFAYYCYKNSFIEIEEVDVIKEHQGQGIGKALIQHIEKIAKEKGIKRLVAGTSVNKEGKPWKAYCFWIHMGFADTKRRIQGLHGLKYVKFVKQLQT